MSEYIVEARQILIARQSGKTPKLTEIVRCRDCKDFVIVDEIHGDYDDYPIYGCRLLKFSNAMIDDEVQEPQDPDGFCAWGTRRDA